jgi:hypothetical protein
MSISSARNGAGNARVELPGERLEHSWLEYLYVGHEN